jgi:hypothetical protein
MKEGQHMNLVKRTTALVLAVVIVGVVLIVPARVSDAASQWTLGLAAAGTGSGTVTGGGNFADGTRATIRAIPSTGSSFAGWVGNVASDPGKGLGCTNPVSAVNIIMKANTTCTATFTAAASWTLSLAKAGTGSGTVTGAGSVVDGRMVTIRAISNAGSRFAGWVGNVASDPSKALGCTNSASAINIVVKADTTCTASFSALPSSPPTPPTSTPSSTTTLSLSYLGKTRDAVGQANNSRGDGIVDGAFKVAFASPSGGRTVTNLDLRAGGLIWDTASQTSFWALGVANTPIGALLNSVRDDINVPVQNGSALYLFAGETANGAHFTAARVFTLIATYSDGSTSMGIVTLPSTPSVPPSSPPTISLSYLGKTRDAVGQASSARVDGVMDGVFTVSVNTSGVRTVSKLVLHAANNTGTWDTDGNTSFWSLGAALSSSGALLNASNDAVNFPVSAGNSTFFVFAGDAQGGVYFPPGKSFTLTATFSDGSSAAAAFTLPGTPTTPPVSPPQPPVSPPTPPQPPAPPPTPTTLSSSGFGSLEQEKAYYRSRGWTWAPNREPHGPPNPAATYHVSNGQDVHGDLEADDLWQNLMMWRRTGNQEYYTMAKAFARYYMDPNGYSLDAVSGGNPDSSFGLDHLFGWGLLDWWRLTGDPQALATAKALGEHVVLYDKYKDWCVSCGDFDRSPADKPYQHYRGYANAYSNSPDRMTGRHLRLVTELWSATGDTKWKTLADKIVNALLTSPTWDQRGSWLYYRNESFNGVFYGKMIATLHFAIINDALWRYYELTQNASVRQRLIDMAKFAKQYGMDQNTQYSGAQIALDQPRPGDAFHSATTDSRSCAQVYTSAMIDTLMRGWKLSGDTSFKDRAYYHWERTSKCVTDTQRIPDNQLGRFVNMIGSTGFLSNTAFYYENGDLPYTWMLFSDVPTTGGPVSPPQPPVTPPTPPQPPVPPPPTADTTAPSTPSGLVATAGSSSHINLSWNAASDNVGVAGYQIVRNGAPVGMSTTLVFSDFGLSSSTPYVYTVAAFDKANNLSGQAVASTATTLAGTPGNLNQAVVNVPANTWVKLDTLPSSHVVCGGFRCDGDKAKAQIKKSPVGRSYSGITYGTGADGKGRIYYWGGGHGSHAGNDIEVFDIARNIWEQPYTPEGLESCLPFVNMSDNQLTESQLALKGTCVSIFGGSGTHITTPSGLPFVDHQYQQNAYDFNRHRFLLGLGSGLFEFDESSKALRRLVGYTPPSTDVHTKLLVYDPDLKTVLWFATTQGDRGVFKFDYSKSDWIKIAGVPDGLWWSDIYAAYDSTQHRHLVSHSTEGFWWFDAGAGTWSKISHAPSELFASQALAYDQTNKVFLIAQVGNSVYGPSRFWTFDGFATWKPLALPTQSVSITGEWLWGMLVYDPTHQAFLAVSVKSVGGGGTGGTLDSDVETWAFRYKP